MDLLFTPVVIGALLLPSLWLWRRRHEPLEAMMLGGSVGIAALGALALGRFFVILPSGTPRLVGGLALGIAVGVGAWLAIRALKTPVERPRPAWSAPLLAAVVGVAAMTIGIEATVPHYGVALLFWDWFEHFDIANFYLAPADFLRHYGDSSTITSRTPLFNLLGSLALATLGDRFTVIQVLTASLGWLWALPAALIARRLIHQRASGSIALLGLSPLILFSSAYAWPKSLVLFFVLVALERTLVLRQESLHAAPPIALQLGLASGLAVMAHAGFVGYLLPLYLLLALDAWRGRQRWSMLAAACVAALLVVLPWYSWGVAQYGWRAGLLGYPQPASPTVALWVIDHVVILASSLLPTSVFIYRGIDPIQNFFIAYLGSAVGLLGVGFLIRGLARMLARSRRRAWRDLGEMKTVLAFAAGGVLIATLLINGWGNGWAAAQAVFLPALITVAIVATRLAPPTRGMILTAVGECVVVVGLALVYMWSTSGMREPNASLAVSQHVHFLGRDTWAIGTVILVAAAACLVRLVPRVLGSQESTAADAVRQADEAA